MKTVRLSDAIAEQIEVLISARGLKAGDRLPAERQLALELNVSRSSLREAIQQLASKGRLTSRTGGGNYVQEPPRGWSQNALVDPLSRLFASDPAYRFDVLEIRHALEGAAAYHATLRATDDDKQRISDCFDNLISLQGSDDSVALARADAAFHLAIADASHNLVLIEVMKGLFDLLKANISQNLEKLYIIPKVTEPLSAQHRELRDAILAGDGERARKATHLHIDFVHSSLKSIDEDEARLARSFHQGSVRG